MPAIGRKPKPEDQRRNRHQPTHEWIDVLNAPYEGGVPAVGRLPARSQRWWSTISRMPHVVLWDESDWQFAIDTAHIHAEWVRTKRGGLASELRLREKLLGTTWDARRDLRIRYVQGVTEAEDAKPTALEEYRKALDE